MYYSNRYLIGGSMKVRKWEILIIIIVIIVSLLLIFFRPLSLEPPPIGNGSSPSENGSDELTIASFESTVLRDLGGEVELEILDYGIKQGRGYLILCVGRVNLIRGTGVSGARAGMYLTNGPGKSVNVQVYVYRGELALPSESISFDQVGIPKLTPDDSSFEFELTCEYV